MRLAEHQGRAEGQRGFAAGEELLALDVELSIKAVFLGVVAELRERGEVACGIADDEVLRAGLVRERNGDAAEFFIDAEFAALKPRDGVFDVLVLFIEHEDQITCGAGLLQKMPLAGADEGAAAAAAADEFDDPGPAFAFEVREGEFLPRAAKWAAFEGVRLLAVGDEAVEIEVGVELTLLGLEEIERVELENLHDELRRVFDDHIECDVVARQELRRVRGGEFDVHAVFECLKLRGRDERGPALGTADAICDESLGKDGLQPGVADEGGVGGEECWSGGVLVG